MFKKLEGIRYQLIGSYLYAVYFSLLIIALILFFSHSVIQPIWLEVEAIILTLIVTALTLSLVGLYVMFRQGGNVKDRLQELSIFIATLSEGKFNATLLMKESKDEFSTLGHELNDLAHKVKGQVKSLERMAEEKSEYAKQAHLAATVEERQRLARDLHDAVSQQLFALSMMSQATSKIIDKKPEQAKEQIEEISQMALQAQNEMRALLLHLRPVHLSGESLHEGIDRLIEELKQRCHIHFKVDVDQELQLSHSKEEHIFRIAQESLSNALRHANAMNIEVRIKEKDLIYIYISDDGDGFNLDQQMNAKASYGLNSIKERCEEIGGTFDIKSKQGEGTYIDIRIPK
ncbi:sensor histidine kinase [Alkalibacillus haloalkaliphilus]|uniref:sensor histidine kinase n=1 Tax=Alkalibacillus haloalkaliphilus TaxID=94136 RepID=UPI0003082052|nr:sensor histidine kinase [Alkalibacillus haloalkaliphilus]